MNSPRNGNFRAQRPRPAGNHKGNRPGPIHRQRPGNNQSRGASSANAQRNYERYLALAREAALNGDAIEMENCYQHAEHYFRVMREQTS